MESGNPSLHFCNDYYLEKQLVPCLRKSFMLNFSLSSNIETVGYFGSKRSYTYQNIFILQVRNIIKFKTKLIHEK